MNDQLRPAPIGRPVRIASVLVFVLACLPFLPLLDAGFVNWDDDRNFVDNTAYRGLLWDNLKWMFTTFHYGGYQPLSWLSVAIDHALWGMDARGYHLTNVLLHALNAVLLFRLILALVSVRAAATAAAVWAAGAAALLFAVHPLRVESVAWITERRGLLAALFCILAVRCYLSAQQPDRDAPARHRLLALSVGMFLLSLLAKVLAIVLPLLLLVLDAWPLRRLAAGGPGIKRLLVEKLPYLAVAAGIGLVARMAQQQHGATYTWDDYGALGRLAQSCYSVWFYLWRTLVPADLCVLHPLQSPPSWSELRFALAGAGTVLVTAVLVARRRRWPALLVAWFAYGILLAPVSGLAQAGPSLVAERYSYLPTAGAWALVAWVLLRAGQRRPGLRRFLVAAVIAVAGVWTALGFAQSRHWHDSVALWRRAIAVHPDAVFAHFNLGGALDARAREAGDAEVARRLRGEAASGYSAATERMPTFGTAWYYLGLARYHAGDPQGAIVALRRALDLFADGHWTHRPQRVEIVYMLGLTNHFAGNVDAAVERLRAAMAADPGYVHTYPLLADLLVQQGERDEAVRLLERAVQIAPGDARLQQQLARLRR